MQRRWTWARLALGMTAWLALIASAQAETALDWLNRAAMAAKQLNYSGIYVYHHGEHVEVMRVSHRIDGGREQEKTEVLDGSPRQFLRINNDVFCHLPDGKHVRLEKNTTRRFFPALLSAAPASLMAYYTAHLRGSERIAGRPCQVVALEPQDGYRYAYQLWLDKQTGLPLKSRIVNENGGVVSMFVFSEVQIGKAPDAQEFRQDLAGKLIQRASLEEVNHSSWQVTPPPGFRQVQEAVRPMPGKKMPVTHRVFSDGLSVLSMFIEPRDARYPTMQGLSAEGAIGVYVRQAEGYNITTLGEVPNTALIETGNSARKP